MLLLTLNLLQTPLTLAIEIAVALAAFRLLPLNASRQDNVQCRLQWSSPTQAAQGVNTKMTSCHSLLIALVI